MTNRVSFILAFFLSTGLCAQETDTIEATGRNTDAIADTGLNTDTITRADREMDTVSVTGVNTKTPDTTINKLRIVENNAFQEGEYLKYRVFYDSWLTSGITAGIVTIKVSDETRMMNGREIYHIWATGKSTGLFTAFYKVRDRYETYLDKESLIPWRFIRHTREGGYVVNDDVYFNHLNNYAKTSKNERVEIPSHVQDFVSAFYYLRTLDFDTAEVNDEYPLDFYLDDSVYISRVIFLGRERVQVEQGVFDCLKFKPQVASGEVFVEPYPMTLWVSDDKNKIPVLGKSAVYVGNVMVELISYKGLKHPLQRSSRKAD